MQKYLGVKIIEAEKMSLISAEEHLQRKIKKGNEPGYLIRYDNNYESWSPKEAFEQAYRKIDSLTFGLAIEALKKGHKVARKGWNDKNMFLLIVRPNKYRIDFGEKDNFAIWSSEDNVLPWIGMKTADNKFVPWLASQADMLAEDWVIIE